MAAVKQSEDDYHIWRSEEGQIIHVPYHYTRTWEIEKIWNAEFVHWFFNKYWSCSIYIAIVYALAVHSLQRYQQSRKPWELRLPLCIWNASLAIFSGIATYRFGEEFVYTVGTRPLLHSVCYSINPTSPAAFWACAFALSKVAELGDTFFVVMRKKPLIFLHWYHHAVVLVYSWNAACELTAAGRWFIFMNFFVHSIMYTYYSFTAYGIRPPRVLSMCITALQTSQMLVGVAISITVLNIKLKDTLCQQSMDNLALCFAIYASFAVLFMRFFYDAYMKPRKAQPVNQSTKKTE
uniref:Elongation of very long chain fatty acids protein n=1 Tax=Parascaris univalens TaxID=6257 RepID=A0A915ALV0_PARUN